MSALKTPRSKQQFVNDENPVEPTVKPPEQQAATVLIKATLKPYDARKVEVAANKMGISKAAFIRMACLKMADSL